jgi:hypothetical protein
VRLDEPQLDELRRWAVALGDAGSEESVAAGRAILMLIDELERLRLELRLAGDRPELGDTETGSDTEDGASAPVSSTLQGRLQRVLRRDFDPSPETRAESVEEMESGEPEGDTASARSWIETLRRQT